jgi:DNA-binding transcriptional MerR regulator
MTETTASSHLSIGEVLSLVQEDFPDVTISKIRFLESQGLIAPERTGSGYRKFYDADIDRLRWILRQQRDHFLPLKVIKKMLDEGVDLHGGTESQPTLWSSADSLPGGSSSDEAQGDDDADHDDESSSEPTGAGDDEARSAGYRSPSHPAVASATARRRPGDQRSEPNDAASTGSSDGDDAVADDTADAVDLRSGSGTSSSGASASSEPGSSQPAHRGEPAGSDATPETPRSASPEPEQPSERDEPASASAARHTPRSPGARADAPTSGDPSGAPSADAPEPARPAHSTPADVVAALQEDPRSAKRGRGRPARAGDAEPVAEPQMPAAASPSPGGFVPTPPLASLLSADELCELCGISAELLAGLEQFGLIVPASLGGRSAYDADAVDVAKIAATYVELGVEPRHLRMYKVAAEREAGFIEQLVVPLIKQRNPAARQQANDRCEDLVAMGAQLHAALLRRQLSRLLGP